MEVYISVKCLKVMFSSSAPAPVPPLTFIQCFDTFPFSYIIAIDLMVSLEQAAYVVLENASSLEVCVIIVNGPDIVPQIEMNVTVFATNLDGSDKGV